MHFFHNTSSPASEKVDAAPTRRRSTTISMMEEEFGMREVPRTTRFGLPSGLRILPPKRKRSSTQAPEPRRNLTGSWETVWGCDIDDGSFVEPPLEEDASASDNVPDDGEGDNWSDRDHDVATPTNGAPWSTDGRITPRFSSTFPNTPNSNALTREAHPDRESLRANALHSVKPYASS